MDLDTAQRLVRVYGKGKKERQLPIGEPALQAIARYWAALEHPPPAKCRCFANPNELRPLYPRLIQMNLKHYLEIAGLDPKLTRTNCATVLPPTCSTGAPTYAACRNCSGTKTSLPPKSTLTLPPTASNKPTTTHIRVHEALFTDSE